MGDGRGRKRRNKREERWNRGGAGCERVLKKKSLIFFLLQILSVAFPSSWRMIHKGSTPFGPTLTLSVVTDNPTLSPPPPLPSSPPPPITNGDAPKSTSHLPSDRLEEEFSSFSSPKPLHLTPSYPADTDVISPTAPSEGSVEESVASSSDQLLQTFEFVEEAASVVSLSSNGSYCQQLSTELKAGDGRPHIVLA